MLTKWIIAIGNTEADGVRMLYAIGSVDQIKRALVESSPWKTKTMTRKALITVLRTFQMLMKLLITKQIM